MLTVNACSCMTCVDVLGRSPASCSHGIEGGDQGWRVGVQGRWVRGLTVFVWDPVNQGPQENQTLISKPLTATICGCSPGPAAWPCAARWSRAAPWSVGWSPLSAPGGIFCLVSGCNSRASQGRGWRGWLSCFFFLPTQNAIFFFHSQCVCRVRWQILGLKSKSPQRLWLLYHGEKCIHLRLMPHNKV